MRIPDARAIASRHLLDVQGNDVLGFVLEATQTGLWTWDVESDLVRCSAETCAILGISLEDFGGTRAALLARVHPEDRARVRRAVSDLLRDRRPWSEDFRIRRPDGAIRWVGCRGRAPGAAGGAPKTVIGTLTDLSGQLAAADALLRRGEDRGPASQSDQRFRALADTAPALLWVTDEQHQCTFLSRGWQAYTGMSEAQGLGMGWIDPVHPEDREQAATAFLDAASHHQPFSLDYRLRRADGVYRWKIDAGRPRFGPRGEFLGYAGSVIDVHERKLAEDQLRRQAALIEGISTGTQDLIAAQDDQYRYVYFNEAYRRTFESLWGRELRVGTSMLEALAPWPDELGKARGLWSRAHAGETFNVTMSFGPQQGARRSFDLRFSPVYDAAGRRLGAAHILRDVTALEASEARLRRIIDSMFTFVAMLEPDGTVTEINEVSLRIGGLSRTDVIGRPFWDCAWWSHDECVRARLIDAFGRATRGEAVRFDVEASIANDGRIIVDIMLQPVFEAGRLVCVIPSGVDITERRRVEMTLAEREAEFRALADQMNQFAWMADGSGSIYWYNQRWFDYTGTTLEEMQGRGWTQVHHPQHVDRVVERIRACFDGGEPWEDQFPLRARDGTYRWFLSRAQPFRNADGRVVRWFGTHTDIEDSRRAMEALTHTADLLRAASEAADLGIYEYELPTGRLEWDARVRALWGVDAEQRITTETFAAGVHPDDRAAVLRRLRDLRDPDGDHRYQAEFRIRNLADGVERWVYATGRVGFVDRRPDRLVGTVQDITVKKEAEARLRRADRQKDVFLATLAHELRNPLAPIRTAAQLLANPRLEPGTAAWAQGVIQRQARNMGLLLDDLLDVSRITQGKLSLKRQRIALAAAVDAAVETAKPLLDRKQHQLRVSLPAEPIMLDADPLRLSQILSNLLTNAAKYTDPGGHVDVEARLAGDDVEIEVRDDGIGIAPATLSLLFETFAQADSSHVRAEGGLGIGLALAKGLVDLHGGTIRASSAGEGRGSTFEIRLPRAPAFAPLDPADADETPVASSGQRVLLVDDNRDGAEALAMLLKEYGHDVRVAYDGRSALAVAQAFRPETAILDIGLPDLTGYDVAQALRAEPWAIGLRLIALTGWGQEDDRQRAIDAGFEHHLTKPADAQRIEALLRRDGRPDDASLAGAECMHRTWS